MEILEYSEIPPPIKMDIVALRLGVIVGPDVLEAAVAALGDRLSATTTADLGGGATHAEVKAGRGEPTPSAVDLKAEIDGKQTT